jgi:hypothetical protein
MSSFSFSLTLGTSFFLSSPQHAEISPSLLVELMDPNLLEVESIIEFCLKESNLGLLNLSCESAKEC